MCASAVYLAREDGEELLMEEVDLVKPEQEEIMLQNIFGEKRRLRARIKEIRLADHRIILEEPPAG